jgi:hypothetical protein
MLRQCSAVQHAEGRSHAVVSHGVSRLCEHMYSWLPVTGVLVQRG